MTARPPRRRISFDSVHGQLQTMSPSFVPLKRSNASGVQRSSVTPAAVVDLDLVPGAAARPERGRALELERRESARRVELPPEPVDGNRDPGLVEADIAIVRLRGCDRGQLLCPSLLPAREVEHDAATLVALEAALEDELEDVRRAPGDPGARLTDLPVHESILGRERNGFLTEARHGAFVLDLAEAQRVVEEVCSQIEGAVCTGGAPEDDRVALDERRHTRPGRPDELELRQAGIRSFSPARRRRAARSRPRRRGRTPVVTGAKAAREIGQTQREQVHIGRRDRASAVLRLLAASACGKQEDRCEDDPR